MKKEESRAGSYPAILRKYRLAAGWEPALLKKIKNNLHQVENLQETSCKMKKVERRMKKVGQDLILPF